MFSAKLRWFLRLEFARNDLILKSSASDPSLLLCNQAAVGD
jgi:hypothetical protein